MIIHVLLDEIGERETEGGTDLDSFNNNCRDIGLRIVKSQYYMNWRKFNFTRGLFLDKCNIDQELSIQFDFIFGRDEFIVVLIRKIEKDT